MNLTLKSIESDLGSMSNKLRELREALCKVSDFESLVLPMLITQINETRHEINALRAARNCDSLYDKTEARH
jgi:hypothetical protein